MGSAVGPGHEIGGFRLVKPIGRGAFGSVYEAEELGGLGRRVAVKVLAGGLADDERYRRRFVAETRALAVLERHPHVVPLYAAGEDQGVLYIAMLLVESDLRAVLHEEGPLPPQFVATAVGQVAEALDYAHSLGFVHRDIKPANVLVAHPGGRLHCYVTDFGIASAPESAESTTGGLGGPRGTYAYMAPETIEARPGRDGRGDGYSLACVAHECLCGSAFFQRASEPATMMAQLKETAPSLAGQLGLVPGVDSVLARELEKDPARRFPTCSSFAETLAIELARAPRRPRRARTALAVAVSLAVGGAGVAAIVARGGGGTSGTLPRWGSPRPDPAIYVPASAVASLTVADLNDDGREDVIVTRVQRGSTARSPVSFLVDRRGTFVDATRSLMRQPIREIAPSAVVVGDLTGDGRLDVLLADAGGPGSRGGETLLVREGGRFVRRPDLLPPDRPSGERPTALAEINDDGRLDVFVDNAPGSAPSELWYGRTQASGGPAFRLVSELLPSRVTSRSADYTAATFVQGGSGPALVLAPGTREPSLLHLEEIGGLWTRAGGMPGTPRILGPDPSATAIIATDLNGDDTPDLVVCWSRADGRGRYVQILIGQHGAADFADETSSLLPQKPNSLAPIAEIRAVDLDGDGDVDLATVLRDGAAGAPMYRNVAHGKLKLVPRSFSGPAGGEYAFVDRSGNGGRDLLVVHQHEAGDPREQSVVLPDIGRSLVPDSVPEMTAQAHAGTIHLSWRYVWGASFYRIYRSTSAYGRGRLLARVKTTSYTDRPRGSGFVWYYQVEAGNARGYGSASAPAKAQT